MKNINLFKIRNNKGLSLIEVLIGLTIISMIMLTIIQFTQSSQDTVIRVTEEDRELLQVETAMARLEWDISQLYTPLYFSQAMSPAGMTEEEGEAYNRIIDSYTNNSRFSTVSYEGIPIPLFKNPEKSTFEFLSLSNRRKFQDIKQSHFAWIRYTIENDDDRNDEGNVDEETSKGTFKLIRNFQPNDIFSDEKIDWDDIKQQVLMRKVISLEFEFWNAETQKFTDNLDIIKNGTNLIRAVKVNLKYMDTDNLEKVTERIFRPLFPDFTPEDMYKFLNKTTTGGTGTSSTSGDSGTSSEGESE